MSINGRMTSEEVYASHEIAALRAEVERLTKESDAWQQSAHNRAEEIGRLTSALAVEKERSAGLEKDLLAALCEHPDMRAAREAGATYSAVRNALQGFDRAEASFGRVVEVIRAAVAAGIKACAVCGNAYGWCVRAVGEHRLDRWANCPRRAKDDLAEAVGLCRYWADRADDIAGDARAIVAAKRVASNDELLGISVMAEQMACSARAFLARIDSEMKP